MENKWYIGQKVWDKTVSDEAGEVVQINENKRDMFPIVVNFNGIKIHYTDDGKPYVGMSHPTLSNKPYEIVMEGFSQEFEEELPKKGQVCWGSGDATFNKYSISHFISKINDGRYKLSDINDEDSSWIAKEITTKNPYAVEEEVSKMETTDREPKVGDMVFCWDEENPSWIGMGILTDIQLLGGIRTIYVVGEKSHWKHCSLKNPLIK